MRFFILNHYAYAPDQSAGVRHYELARQVAKEGHEAIILSCSFFHKTHSWRPGARFKLYSRERVEGVDYVWVFGFPYQGNGIGRIINLISFAFLSVIYLLIKGGKGDVLYASSPQPIAPFFAFILSGRRYFKVFEIRDFWPRLFVDMGSMKEGSLLAKAFYRIESYLISSADVFVSNLSGAPRYCDERKVKFKRFFWVPNGVRGRYDQSSIAPALLSGSPDNLRVVYTGAHGEAQNLYSVLDAAKELLSSCQVEFHFLGDGSEKRRLMEYAVDNNISNVFFYDPVNTKEVKRYIVAADLLLLPLVNAKVFSYGISPNKLPEYLSSGRPIIFFGPKQASPFTHRLDGIVTEGTRPCDLIAAIRYFEGRPDARKKIAEGGDRLMDSKFLLDRSMGGLVQEIVSFNHD